MAKPASITKPLVIAVSATIAVTLAPRAIASTGPDDAATASLSSRIETLRERLVGVDRATGRMDALRDLKFAQTHSNCVNGESCKGK